MIADVVAVLFLMYAAAKVTAACPWLLHQLGCNNEPAVGEGPKKCDRCNEIRANHFKVYKGMKDPPPVGKCSSCADPVT